MDGGTHGSGRVCGELEKEQVDNSGGSISVFYLWPEISGSIK